MKLFIISATINLLFGKQLLRILCKKLKLIRHSTHILPIICLLFCENYYLLYCTIFICCLFSSTARHTSDDIFVTKWRLWPGTDDFWRLVTNLMAQLTTCDKWRPKWRPDEINSSIADDNFSSGRQLLTTIFLRVVVSWRLPLTTLTTFLMTRATIHHR